MYNYNYCKDCLRVFADSTCPFCNSSQVSVLNINAPVNILGTKTKGRVFKQSSDEVKVLITDESHNKSIREFSASKIRKIL